MNNSNSYDWNDISIKINNMKIDELIIWLKTQNKNTLDRLYLNAKDVYYNKTLFDNRNVLKDSHFDIIEDYLSARGNKYNTANIGIEPPESQSNREALPYFMPSMNKIKTSFTEVDKKLEKWVCKYRHPPKYVYSDKMDGVSGMYVYNSGFEANKQHQLYTRGDGQIGTNISHFISKKYMPFLYEFKEFLNKKKELTKLVIRGEFILPKHLFNIEKHGSNARNFVSGVINSKMIDIEYSSIIDFVIYELIEPGDNMCFYDKMCFLKTLMGEYSLYIYDKYTGDDESISNKTLNVKCVFMGTLSKEEINKERLLYLLEDRKEKSEYDCDGIIIVHDALNTQNTMTYREYKNPEYAFAFKHDDSELFVWTTVEDVIWNISKHGLLKPTIKVSQISINNVNIEYTTGFNAAFIKNNNITKDTRVCIKRSGDVIPVITEIEYDASSTALMPSVEYVWNDTGVDILIDAHIIKNSVYYVQYLTKRLHHFTKTMGIKHLGEASLEKCVYTGIDNITKLCSMTCRDWMNVGGIKEKGATKIVSQVKQCLTDSSLTLYTLMDASCCFGSSIGPKKMEKIATHKEGLVYISDFLMTDNTVIQMKCLQNLSQLLPTIDDIGNKNTIEFIEGLREFKSIYNSLLKIPFNKRIGNLLMTTPDKRDTDKNNNTKEKNFNIVFTGFRNKELETSFESLGYSIGTSVTKTTKAVVVKDSLSKSGTSSKLKKANELNIPIYDQEECLHLCTLQTPF